MLIHLTSSSACISTYYLVGGWLNNSWYLPGYIQDLDKFLDVVENDAVNFKPLGNKIHSYTRPSRSPPISKGEPGSSTLSTNEVVEYEVYHVRRCLQRNFLLIAYPGSLHVGTSVVSLLGKQKVSGSTTVKCNYSSFSTSKAVRTFRKRKKHGNLLFCTWCAVLGYLTLLPDIYGCILKIRETDTTFRPQHCDIPLCGLFLAIPLLLLPWESPSTAESVRDSSSLSTCWTRMWVYCSFFLSAQHIDCAFAVLMF